MSVTLLLVLFAAAFSPQQWLVDAQESPHKTVGANIANTGSRFNDESTNDRQIKGSLESSEHARSLQFDPPTASPVDQPLDPWAGFVEGNPPPTMPGVEGGEDSFGELEGAETNTNSTALPDDLQLGESTTPTIPGVDESMANNTTPVADGTSETTIAPAGGFDDGAFGETMETQTPSASPSASEVGLNGTSAPSNLNAGDEITLTATPSVAPSIAGEGGMETGTSSPSGTPSVIPTIAGDNHDISQTPTIAFDDENTSVPTANPVYNWGDNNAGTPTLFPTLMDDDNFGDSGFDYWNKKYPTVNPTPRPTVQYVPLTDDPLTEEEGEVPVGEFNDDKFGGIKGKIDTYMEGVESPEAMEKDKNVQVVAGVLVAVFVVLWLVTAHQVMENPDGLCAGFCRLILKLICCIIRVLCLPCRYLCCKGSDQTRSRRTHSPMRSEFPTDLELA
eukprot:CAMPEP_0171328842 /NCGR_PEP_ID=MMETSP0878-20121228/878_1 /TAXON_ID=67004 /ORGANISM="Thalassiosira weissflogii, Strain CCMP1336" /LENGTH=447 /DNA_ID=CAMNT_0011828723 /DNA_START=13 /DNA_END=1356 /DNA_ORIENTATION=+